MTVTKRGYTYQEAAAYLGTTKRAIEGLVTAKVLPVVYLSPRKPVINIDDLETYFASRPTESVA